jgi:hypothetical protein
MRKLLAMTLVAGLLVFAGCGKPKTAPPTGGTTTSPASKPPAPPESKPASKPVDPPPDESKISLELPAVEVAKGEKAEVTIKVVRTNAKGDIKVTFEPKDAEGVKIEPPPSRRARTASR